MLADHGVIHLGDGEADLPVAVDEGNHLQLQHDVLKVDIGADAVGIRQITDAAGGHWNAAAGGDDGFFVVGGIDGRPAQDGESLAGFERMDKHIQTVVDPSIDVETAQGIQGAIDDGIAHVGDRPGEGVPIDQRAGHIAFPITLELLEVVDAELHSVIEGELADDRGQINLGWFVVQPFQEPGDLQQILWRAVGDKFVGLHIGHEAGLAYQYGKGCGILLRSGELVFVTGRRGGGALALGLAAAGPAGKSGGVAAGEGLPPGPHDFASGQGAAAGAIVLEHIHQYRQHLIHEDILEAPLQRHGCLDGQVEFLDQLFSIKMVGFIGHQHDAVEPVVRDHACGGERRGTFGNPGFVVPDGVCGQGWRKLALCESRSQDLPHHHCIRIFQQVEFRAEMGLVLGNVEHLHHPQNLADVIGIFRDEQAGGADNGSEAAEFV